MKLSIIVPIYKVEKYLSHCLDSLLDQDLDSSDYEIICINDGSPDACKTIVLAYQEKHSNIVFIDQENQGVSVARNRGLDVAKGQYILFVDPDDTIVKNSLPSILTRAVADDLDIMYLSLVSYDEKDVFLHSALAIGDEDIIVDGFSHGRRTYIATLYKSSTINKIRYVKGILRGQDTVFNAMVQTNAIRCSYCSIPYYNYTQRADSSRQFVRSDKVFHSNLLAITTLYEFQKKHFPQPNPIQQKYFDEVLSVFVQRSFEWNIIPNKNINNFNQLKTKLKDLGLSYVLESLSKEIKNCNKPFYSFLILNWFDAKMAQLSSIFKTQ
jgi:glycosyltransferase involved in cell wall biosynthesis